MKRKLSNQFLTNYLIVFLLTMFATGLAFILLSIASGVIEGTLAKNRFPAKDIIQADYTLIDTAEIVRNGGGVQIVDLDYRIVRSDGLNPFTKNQFSTQEFTDFLTDNQDMPYHYDILYEPEGEFWLIVTFPTSLRLNFSVVHNPKATAGDMERVGVVIGGVVLIYLLILALFTILYARISALRITIPLRKLKDGTRLLREGDYSARVDLRLTNEFAELQHTFNDMAERIENEMALRKKSESDRQRLILDISHDLKNPLSSIQGYTELCLQNQVLPEKELRTYLEVIHQNSKRANLLLSELFELSQMDSPAFTIKLEKMDLCEYLRRTCGEIVPLLEQAGFSYEFNIPEESIFALLDPNRFGRIIQNLLDNTIRYNPKGTTVLVGLVIESGYGVISFSDDGRGIPTHLKEDIFKPFVRVDDSRNSKTGGSGLGLSIAKKIALAHSGDLMLSSESNKGSHFILTIPIQ